MEEINLEIFEAEKHRERPVTDKKPDKQEKKKKRKLIITFVIVIAVLAISAAAVMIYPLLSSAHNPNRFVEKYVKDALNNDWMEVYSDMPYIDSPFISYEGFMDYINANPKENPLDNADPDSFIIEQESTENDLYYYSVDFLDKNQEWQTSYITVKKVKDRFWKYDKYKIIPNQDLICEAKIYAPNGAKIHIDGIEITNISEEKGLDPQTGKEISYSVFTSDYMFSGEHDITAEMAGCDSYENKINVSKENADIYLELRVSEDNYNNLCATAKSAVQAVYSSAVGEDADTGSLTFSSSFGENGFNTLVKETGEFVYASTDGISVSGIQITSTKMSSEYEPDIFVTYNESDEININFSFEYKYKISNNIENTSEEKYNTGYASVKFEYENSVWAIDNIAVRAFF